MILPQPEVDEIELEPWVKRLKTGETITLTVFEGHRFLVAKIRDEIFYFAGTPDSTVDRFMLTL